MAAHLLQPSCKLTSAKQSTNTIRVRYDIVSLKKYSFSILGTGKIFFLLGIMGDIVSMVIAIIATPKIQLIVHILKKAGRVFLIWLLNLSMPWTL